jgi:hypothetical protein
MAVANTGPYDYGVKGPPATPAWESIAKNYRTPRCRPQTFGYKDFIPLFTAAKWDPVHGQHCSVRLRARLVMRMGENFTFINPPPQLRTRLEAARADLFAPKVPTGYFMVR